MRRLLVVTAVSIALAVGCGGKPASAPAASGEQTPPADSSPLDSGAPESAAQDGSASSAPDAAPASAGGDPAPMEKMDDCAPMVLDFENALRPKFKKCWLDVAKKKPNERIIGTARYLIEVDGFGKIATMKLAEKSDLPEPIQTCMMKVLKAEPFDAKKCPFKSLTISEKFPR